MKQTATTADAARDAMLWQFLRRSIKAGTCGICATVREDVTDTDGQRYRVCPKCGDAQLVGTVEEGKGG